MANQDPTDLKEVYGFPCNAYESLKLDNAILKAKLTVYEQNQLNNDQLQIKINELERKLKDAEAKIIEQDMYFNGRLMQAMDDYQTVREESKNSSIKLYEIKKLATSTITPMNLGGFEGIEVSTFATGLCKVLNEFWLGVKFFGGEWTTEEARLKEILQKIKQEHIRMALEGLLEASGRVISEERI